MSDIRHWFQTFFWQFIELHQSYLCLWNVKAKSYSSRSLKDQAYGILLKKLQEVEPEATKEIVKKEINSFRTVFQKEKDKVRLERSCAGADDIYKPNLWYFFLLNFLDNQETLRSSTNSIIIPLWDHCQCCLLNFLIQLALRVITDSNKISPITNFKTKPMHCTYSAFNLLKIEQKYSFFHRANF